MASIISELRSVNFQSQSTTTVFVSELNIQKHNIMAPQQQDTLPKSSDFEVDQHQKASPVSNLGTSVESCSPVSNGDAAETMKSNKDEKMEYISSDDSGSVQNYHVHESEYTSPLMRLQSALRKDGKLGKKLNLSSPLPQNHTTNNWLSAANGVLERNLPTSSSVTTDKSFSIATTAIPSNNSSSTTNDVYPNNLTSTGMFTNLTSSPPANYNNNFQSMHNGMCHSRSSVLPPGSYPDCSPHNTPRQFNENNALLCRICDFTCMSQEDLDSHLESHYSYKCPRCTYRSKTEGRLTRHLTEFHSEIPPDNWTGSRAKAKLNNSDQLLDNSVSSSNNKTRAFRCKHCTFVAYTKSDFWRHVRTHIKPDKLLECEQCEFVTEFKHHYEYHISNHAGRKPFKCSMCNYKCVNKSMLNSHLKSHSNVYQFHCADCKYETKYCHSIKQHLKKHNHKPGVVLNQDGTPCPFQVIDVYGRRRGPRTKKRKLEMSDENCLTSSVPSATQLHTVPTTSQHSLPFSTSVPMLQPNIPTVYPHFFSDYSQSLMMRNSPQMRNSSFPLPMSVTGRNPICCTMCHFMTHDTETLKRHMLLHIAAENQDIAKLYGIYSEFFNDQQLSLPNDTNGQKNGTEPGDNDKKFIPPEYERELEYHEGIRSYKQEHDVDENIKCEDRSSPKNRATSSPAVEENDSYKGYSTPSPQYSSSHSPDFIFCEKKDETNQRTSPTMLLENQMHVDESPIDLSGRKSSDSVYNSKVTEGFDTQNSELNTPASTSTTEPSNVSSSSQRNRRKGKAYRIHYVQYDEQSSHQEFPKGNAKHNTTDMSTTEGEVKKSEKEHNLVRMPSTSPDKQQNIEVHTITEDDNINLRQENKIKSNSPADRLVSSPVAIKGNCLSSSNTQPVRIESSNDRTFSEPAMKSEKNSFVRQDTYECNHCGIAFKNSAMYSVHMGYHGYMNPFTCNLCGHVTDNAVEFFVHIARVPHP